MIFGHLPAGYITSGLLLKKFENYSINQRAFILWGMFGAIAPDLDLFYYLLIDPFEPRNHHHKYVTHSPVFWLTLLLISVLWLLWHQHRGKKQAAAFIFALNGFIHIVLDNITDHIFWVAPFMQHPIFLTADTSAAANYFTHRAFGLELLLIVWALSEWYRSFIKKRTERNKPII